MFKLLELLLNNYDVLLLDEPTNDLDIDSLEWLEKFINNTLKPIIYVSHDETLLSNTANMILHLEQRKKKSECVHTLLKVDYDTYINNESSLVEKINSNSRSILNKKNSKYYIAFFM